MNSIYLGNGDHPIALIDGTFLLVHACHAPKIEEDTAPTTIFMKKMWDFRSMGSPIVFFDGRRPRFRTDLLADYKKKSEREPTEKEVEKAEEIRRLKNINLPIIKQLMLRMGVPVLHHPEYESDDQVGVMARYYRSQGRAVTAITSDSDYFQLIPKGVKVHRPYHDETVGRAEFVEKFGFDPEYYVMFLSMTGTHNAVPGIGGIGPVRAKAIISDLSEPTLEHLQDWAKRSDSKWANLIREKRKEIKRNKLLIDFDSVPLSEDEMLSMLSEHLLECKYSHRDFLSMAVRLKIPGQAKWVPWLQGRKS